MLSATSMRRSLILFLLVGGGASLVGVGLLAECGPHDGLINTCELGKTEVAALGASVVGFGLIWLGVQRWHRHAIGIAACPTGTALTRAAPQPAIGWGPRGVECVSEDTPHDSQTVDTSATAGGMGSA